jgi:hypothetical protein
MPLVVVERTFEDAVDPAELQSKEDSGAWCLEQHDVKFLRTFISGDRKRYLCVYEAPDAESVRLSQKMVDMPVDRVWLAKELQNDPAKEIIVAERVFEVPVRAELARAWEKKTGWCFEMYDVTKTHTYLSADGHRGFCAYVAPDAEAVRNGNRKGKIPYTTIWDGIVLEPGASEG